MTRICFVSYEIYPTTWGGCGTLLHNAAEVLLSQGHEVIFVLDIPRLHFEQFLHQDRLGLPHNECCRAYHVDSLCGEIDVQRTDFMTEAQWQSYRFHYAAQQVAAIERPDVIEFFDYCGVGHYAMAAKISKLGYQHSHLVVRLHNSLELMDNYEATTPLDIERFMYYALEHSALQMAETIVHPSSSYLTKAYQPLYESWWGQQIFSKPPLVNVPQRTASVPNPRKILFYGRLFAFKGVDRFVDAAVALLHTGNAQDALFVLVGYDSMRAPDGSASYQEYLRKKIPGVFQEHFEFTGQLDRPHLEALLPDVRFAVFPSYLEAFCYAAHELYAAGIPLIVSDIPNFDDYFHHNVNALVFNGSTDDLSYQMKRLNADSTLREQLRLPFPVAEDPLGHFYEGPFGSTWMVSSATTTQLSLLVCIIAEASHLVSAAIRIVDNAKIENLRVVVFQPYNQHIHSNNAALWFLGALYVITDNNGQGIAPTELRTAETLFIMRAEDIIKPEYLRCGLDILAQQPQIVFVGSWKHVHTQNGFQLDTFPLDKALEIAPLRAAPTLNRVIMRTNPNHLLMDLFDTQAGVFGETLYLWHLDTAQQRGLLIPRALIIQHAEVSRPPSPALLSYFIAQAGSEWRRKRLTQYLATTQNTYIQHTTLAGIIPVPLAAPSIGTPVIPTARTAIYRHLRTHTVEYLRRNQRFGQPLLAILRAGRSIVQILRPNERS